MLTKVHCFAVLMTMVAVGILGDRSALGQELTDEIQISTASTPNDAERHRPAIAHNYVNDQHLVVWLNNWQSGHRDIYAQRVSEEGQLVGGWFAVSAGTNDRTQPAVAFNATNDEYLVVWMYDVNGDGSKYEIWGRVVAWNGSYLGPETLIITWANRSFWTPRVTWNSYRNEYLVVWSAFDTSSGSPGIPHDVAGYRVSAAGSVINPGSPLIFDDTASPHQADVVYNVAVDGYLVVFVRVYLAAATGNDVYGVRVNWDGSLVAPGAVGICTDAYNQHAPRVATNEQDRFMVVWQSEYEGDPDDDDIWSEELDVALSSVASTAVETTAYDEESPAVAGYYPTREWLVVFQLETTTGWEIRARRLGSPGSGVSSFNLAVSSYPFWANENPAVAAQPGGYLVAYEGDSVSDPSIVRHVYGRVLWPDMIFSDGFESGSTSAWSAKVP